jgi:hypothetical protein
MIHMLMASTLPQPIGHTAPQEWLFLVGFVSLLLAGIAALVARGNAGERRGAAGLVERLADSLRRLTGLPAWSAGGIFLAIWSLLVAGFGFYWDVAWHIDLGRDAQLFTPPHLMILTGLMGIGVSGLLAIGLATFERADAGWRLGPLRIPYSVIPIGLLSTGAVIGFPLDDLWHRTYGVDVTMWSPTHLMMIGGASLTPVAAILMLAEGGRGGVRPVFARGMAFRLASAALVGMSTFQLEYDLGVPQWQPLYQPVLMMLAAATVLVAARVALGRWAALFTSISFVITRGLWALIIGPGLGHTTPRLPLYIGVALAIEGAAFAARRMPLFGQALVMGGAAGTLGLASEWAFSQVWSRHPWQPELLGHIWVPIAVAICGAVVGAAIARVITYQSLAIPLPAVALAVFTIVALMAIPFPRNTAPVQARMVATPAAEARLQVDQFGYPSTVQDMNIDITVTPAAATAGADWFEVVAWQGGHAHNIPFKLGDDGHYHSVRPVPTGGTWKTLAWLVREDVLLAAPIAMPANPEINQAAIPVQPVRDTEMVRASELLVRPRDGGLNVSRAITIAWFVVLFGSGMAFLVALAAMHRHNRRLGFPVATVVPLAHQVAPTAFARKAV